MQIVINISDSLYDRLIDMNIDSDTCSFNESALVESIQNGTPLPKGHGELKDADVMINKLCTHEASELFGSTTCAEILDFINSEKPIIEADKEQENGANKST